jgi:VWFA-related protein
VPTLHVTSRLVVLDVVVTDSNGNPVRGLKPSDFTLTEDGFLQHISSFVEYSGPSNAPIVPPPPLPPNTFSVQPPPPESVTKTVIVLDDLHYPNYPLVRADILAFVKTLPAGNPFCVIRMDWRGLHLVQDFTSDPQILRQAVASRRMLGWPNIDPLHFSTANPYSRLARYVGGIPGRINLAWITDEGGNDAFLGQEYSDIDAFVDELNGPTGVLRLGRIAFYAIKAGGYIGGLLQPIPTPDIVFAQSPGVAFPVAPGAAYTLPPGWVSPDSHDISFARVPGTIGGVPPDPALMPASEGSLLANQDLADEAARVGGHAFFDGAAKALPQILALGSDYYTVAYVPNNTNWDGEYRSIEVNVAGVPSAGKSKFGWTAYGQPQVSYRRGYVAGNTPAPGFAGFGAEAPPALAASRPASVARFNVPPEELPTMPPPWSDPPPPSPIDAAMEFGTIPPNQVYFTIAVSPSQETEKPRSAPAIDNFLDVAYRDAPYRNYHIHYWIDPKYLKFSRADGMYRDDLQFVAIVYGDNGLAVNSISTKAHIQFPTSALRKIMASGVVFDQSVAVPAKPSAGRSGPYTTPESFYLRIGVNETSTDHIGAIEIPVETIKVAPVADVAENQSVP